MNGERARDRGPGGPSFWLLSAVGLGVVGFGLAGLLRNVRGPQLLSWGEFVLGALVVHDGLLMPVVAVGSLALVRLLPARVRPPLQAAIVLSAVATLVAIPLLGGYGRRPSNPSFLPDGDYWANLGIVLGVVWAVAIAVALGRFARRGRTAGARGREGTEASAHHGG